MEQTLSAIIKINTDQAERSLIKLSTTVKAAGAAIQTGLNKSATATTASAEKLAKRGHNKR